MSEEEKRVLLVFAAVSFCWMSRSFVLNDILPALDDTIIALAGALLLFLIPAGKGNKGKLLDWKTAEKLPWGILLLFGGGLTIAASCAFLWPVATPPNAIVFGSGYLTIPDMMRTGAWMNIISIILLFFITYLLVPLLWNYDINAFPDAFRE